MTMRAALTLCVLVSGPLAHALAAPASCSQGIDLLSKRIPGVADAHMKAVLENDLRQAHREEAEGDDDECAEVLEHAGKVLAQGQ